MQLQAHSGGLPGRTGIPRPVIPGQILKDTPLPTKYDGDAPDAGSGAKVLDVAAAGSLPMRVRLFPGVLVLALALGLVPLRRPRPGPAARPRRPRLEGRGVHGRAGPARPLQRVGPDRPGRQGALQPGYGMANLEHDVPNTPQTKFRLGSITKQFTAMAILILQERGKLKVEDKVKKYLPDAPKAWDEITIHHLLTHTSGIPNYTAYPEFLKTLPVRVTLKELIAKFKDKPLDFKPGEKFRYSNSGYVVLGQIIEKVSGKNYASFLKEAIFDPLGDERHGLRQRHAPILKHRASGYTRRLGIVLTNCDYLDMSIPHAAGALYSTVEDLLKWDQALYSGEARAQEVARGDVHAVQGQLRLRLGDRQEVRPDAVRARRRDHGLRHDHRALPGRQAAGRRPEQPRELPGRRHRRRPGRHRAGDKYVIPREPKVAKVDPALYDAYAGRYEADMPGKGKRSHHGLQGRDAADLPARGKSRVVLVPESETSFYIRAADSEARFVKDAAGKVASLVLIQDGQEITARRLPAEAKEPPGAARTGAAAAKSARP